MILKLVVQKFKTRVSLGLDMDVANGVSSIARRNNAEEEEVIDEEDEEKEDTKNPPRTR